MDTHVYECDTRTKQFYIDTTAVSTKSWMSSNLSDLDLKVTFCDNMRTMSNFETDAIGASTRKLRGNHR